MSGREPSRRSPSIAAVAIARNEEQDIEGYLRNLTPWVDEIVIVDDGSSDNTEAVVRKLAPDAIFETSPIDSETGFGGQRNKGIELASADWLLHMDIDERVTPQLAEQILAAICDPEMNAYRYRRLNFFLHRPMQAGGWQYWNKAQLARRGAHHFVNTIHEECVVEGGDGKTGQLSGLMWHLNDRDYVERVGKNLHYMQLTGDDILGRGTVVRWHHVLLYPLYRALKSYFLQGGVLKGMTGLVFALYTFSSCFNWYAYAWDKQNRVPRRELERELEKQWMTKAAERPDGICAADPVEQG